MKLLAGTSLVSQWPAQKTRPTTSSPKLYFILFSPWCSTRTFNFPASSFLFSSYSYHHKTRIQWYSFKIHRVLLPWMKSANIYFSRPVLPCICNHGNVNKRAESCFFSKLQRIFKDSFLQFSSHKDFLTADRSSTGEAANISTFLSTLICVFREILVTHTHTHTEQCELCDLPSALNWAEGEAVSLSDWSDQMCPTLTVTFQSELLTFDLRRGDFS